MLFLIAGVVVLCMTMALALATLVGPLAGGLIAALITFGIAYGLFLLGEAGSGEAQVTDTPKVAAARIEVERTRAALLDTAHELQERLQPKTLASEAWEKAKDKGADLAEDAVDAVAKRPVAVGGVVAAMAMFLAREPLKEATVKFYDAMTPLFEPRPKSVALKEKTASQAQPGRAAKRQARAPRQGCAEEDGESMMARQQTNRSTTTPIGPRAGDRRL